MNSMLPGIQINGFLISDDMPVKTGHVKNVLILKVKCNRLK